MARNLTVRWLVTNVRKAIWPKTYPSDYWVLTPPFLKTQWVLNKRSGAIKKYKVRHSIDVSVLHQIFLHEDYQLTRLPSAKSIFARYQQVIAQNRTPLIVDCGANIGLSAVYFSELFPLAKIVALEPESGNVAQARKHCLSPNVEVLEAAVSAESGHGSLVDPGLGSWGFRVESDRSGSIRFVSIDELLSQYCECEPFIVKIDIEGFEKDLFSKNSAWANKFFVLIIELHDWMLPAQGISQNFLKTIGAFNRDFLCIGENVFSVSNAKH